MPLYVLVPVLALFYLFIAVMFARSATVFESKIAVNELKRKYPRWYMTRYESDRDWSDSEHKFYQGRLENLKLWNDEWNVGECFVLMAVLFPLVAPIELVRIMVARPEEGVSFAGGLLASLGEIERAWFRNNRAEQVEFEHQLAILEMEEAAAPPAPKKRDRDDDPWWD